MNTLSTYKIGDHPNKADVIEKHRDINVDIPDWYEFTIDYWKEKLEALGYGNPDIMFSGFWSQGDGASFTCDQVPLPSTDPGVMEAWNQLVRAAALLGEDITEEPGDLAYGSMKRSRGCHYYHESSVDLYQEWNDPPYGNMTPPDGLQPFVDALIAAVESYFSNLEDTVRDLCRQIYRDLEKEYEYLTSDEAVEETLDANEYEFDEEGDIV
jgi:hypothetical protein